MKRRLEKHILGMLDIFPAAEIVGPRQIGKTTLASEIARARDGIVYDLQNRTVRSKLSENPVAELEQHADKLVIIDEIHSLPELYQDLRVAIDHAISSGKGKGKFLLLDSARGRLQRQMSEPLTGRVARLRLLGLDWLEVASEGDLNHLWDCGGYPRSYLADSFDSSMAWRKEYLRTSLERDAAALGVRVPFSNLALLLNLLAASQGSTPNMTELGTVLGVRYNTIGRYLDILAELMLVRRLPAYVASTNKSLVKRPKYYICDSGLLHAIHNCTIRQPATPQQERMVSASWEGFVIENILAAMPHGWRESYYRDHAGKEIDLVLERPGAKPWAIEIKRGHAASLTASCKRAVAELQPERFFQVHSGTARDSLGDAGNWLALPLADMMTLLIEQQIPALASPQAQSASASSEDLTELLAALDEDRRTVPILRSKIVADRLARIRDCASIGSGPDDKSARKQWALMRKELVQWLKRECKLARTDSPDSAWADDLQALLEGLLDIKLTLAIPGQSYRTNPALAGWLAYDLFVNVVAAHLEARKYMTVHDLLARHYYSKSSMHPSQLFWSPAGVNKQNNELAQFVLHEPALPAVRLIEADLLAMLHDVLASNAKEEDAIWCPRLFQGDYGLELESFIRATVQQEGMRNLLTCLGLEGSSAYYAMVKEKAKAYADTLPRSVGFSSMDLMRALRFSSQDTPR